MPQKDKMILDETDFFHCGQHSSPWRCGNIRTIGYSLYSQRWEGRNNYIHEEMTVYMDTCSGGLCTRGRCVMEVFPGCAVTVLKGHEGCKTHHVVPWHMVLRTMNSRIQRDEGPPSCLPKQTLPDNGI